MSISVDIKIGFLVGSKRQPYDRTYSRPGRHLIHAFNYSIHEVNRNHLNHRMNNSRLITFIPILAETYGNESESIRQTIALITKHNVDFIVGPQETCQVESKIASVFNIGMISHFCTQLKQPSQQQFTSSEWFQSKRIESPQTYIQTKPPYWKIVQRVTTLVGRLIRLENWYPQQFVLLYFKESPPANKFDKRFQLSLNSSNDNSNRQQDTSYLLSNEAIQYKLIGELLEIKLNELLLFNKGKFEGKEEDEQSGRVLKGNNGQYERSANGSFKRKPLVVLNWHTTFHYGYTKNPFRQLIRRYLFQQPEPVSTGFVNQSIQCNAALLSTSTSVTTTTTTPHHYQGTRTRSRRRRETNTIPTLTSDRSSNSKLNPRASIYIVVGHYYEHLGLMSALNELGLLGSQQRQPQHNQQQHRPSVLANQQESVVIGVDIEQYDERDDSVRFLRGLLMDENGNSRQQQSRSEEDLDSIASMYRRYLGVVPAKPTKSAEFLNDIRQLYEQRSASNLITQQQLQSSVKLDDGITTLRNQTESTIDTIQLTYRLLQLIRLPAEAFYLHDSIELLDAFFNDCILVKNLTLNECRLGSRAFEWFKNRKYFSFVNKNLTNFDSQARTEGLYTLITRKVPSNESNDSEDEFGLVPVGRFLTSANIVGSKDIVFDVDFASIDSVWLPLWCDVTESNNSKCIRNISDEFSYDDFLVGQSTSHHQIIVVGLILLIILVVCLNLTRLTFEHNFPDLKKQFTNDEWFNLNDEKNFLDIVHNYLISLDNIVNKIDATPYEMNSIDIHDHLAMSIELHCYMFPFPSCKFVHWLTALHQIKEMMFQYQTKSLNNVAEKSKKLPHLMELFKFSHRDSESALKTTRNFFTTKHKGTGSLRLLLNKYKTINECFCNLTKLNHESVAKLKGVTLIHGCGEQTSSRMARLVMEQPERGNLRDCFKCLPEILDKNEADEFKRLVLLPLISDLLNGLEYLHKSSIKFHGELRSTSCMLTLNWRLKLSGFQVQHMRRSLGEYEQKNLSLKELEGLIYSAPEVLENYNRRSTLNCETLKLADIYSFAFVIYEMFVNEEPWSCLTQVSKSKLLIERVKVDSTFRPPLSRLESQEYLFKSQTGELDSVELFKSVIRSCWSYSPELRPQSIEAIKFKLKLSYSPASASLTKNSPAATLRRDSSTSNSRRIVATTLEDITTKSTPMIETQLEIDTATASSFSIPISSKLVSIATFKSSNNNNNDDGDDDHDDFYYRNGKIQLDCTSKNDTSSTTTNNITRYYTKILERSCMLHRKELCIERQTNKLLRMKLLPKSIVMKLENGERIAPAKKYECVSLCAFRFTITFDHLKELLFIDFLNRILFQLDKLVESYQNHVHLLDSQVDSSVRFIAYSGEPLMQAANNQQQQQDSRHSHDYHPQLIASFALQLIDLVNRWQSTNQNNHYIQLSCGLHSGPLLGGILSSYDHYNDSFSTMTNMSTSLLRYVLLGSTMQLANILEQTCHAQKIHISSEFKTLIISSNNSLKFLLPAEFENPTDNNTCQGYVVIKREGRIQAKKFGEINTYWLLNGPRLNASQSLMMIA